MRLITFSLCLFVTFAAAGPKKDYLTENELDLVREAQDLGPRIDAYLRLAKRRLIVLGLTDKSKQDIDQEKAEQAEYDRTMVAATAARVNKADVDIMAPVTDFSYLKNFSDDDLLRGYIQAIDESMTNIDDFYERKANVRDSVENLEKFTRETMIILKKYQPHNAAERLALQDALAKAKEANDGAKDALKKVPKTEKSPPAH